MRNLLALMTVVGLICAGPAAAARIAAGDWKTFQEESFGQYGEKRAADFEDQLYLSLETTKSQDAAIADFATRMKLTPDQAQTYAQVIVDIVVWQNGCDRSCELKPGVPLYDEVERVAMAEPSGRLLTVLGRYMQEQRAGPAFIRLAWGHPAALDIFFGIYDDNAATPYLIAALMKLPDDPSAVPLRVLRGSTYSGLPDELSGLVPAVIEATEARLANTQQTLAWRANLAQFAIDQRMALGMDDAAVDRYLAYPADIRARLPFTDTPADESGRCAHISNTFTFAKSLAAALWNEGHTDEARALMNYAYPKDWVRSPGAQDDADMVADAMTPVIPDADLFGLYIEGRKAVEDKGKQDAFKCGRYSYPDRSGWLSRVQGTAERRLIAGRLRTAGYRDMADHLANWTLYEDTYEVSLWTDLTDLLPPSVTERQPEWARRIATRRAASEPAVDESTIHVTVTPMPKAWTEMPLPAGLAAAQPDEEGADLPEGLDLPVPAYAVLRYEAQGDDAVVVYNSSEYDLSGEIPASGLWLAERKAGAWQKPLYLGLQQHFPYVVPAKSNLPLMADGHVRLEVQVREIDPGSITFPPVGLRYKREQSGLYLDIDLALLAADGDGDGLTDIEEARLGLKPADADSDGDGLADGIDPLPLTTHDPAADRATAQVARIILQKLLGHDQGALVVIPQDKTPSDLLSAVGAPARQAPAYTLILVSDRDIFSGIIAAPVRLVVYSSADVKRLGRDDAPFYPPQIQEIFTSLDGKDIFVRWSASWVGGSFLVHCDGDTCTSKELESWIT